MGLFDYVNCKYPLPIEGANALDFQTKDTDAQFMDSYEIREDGTIWHEVYDTEDRSDPKATGLSALMGMATRVNKRWEQDIFTGEIVFYGSIGNDYKTGTRVEFSAYFADGKLMHLHDLSNQREAGK